MARSKTTASGPVAVEKAIAELRDADQAEADAVVKAAEPGVIPTGPGHR